MQRVNTDWEDTNRAIFANKPHMTVSLDKEDVTAVMFGGDEIISFNTKKSGDLLSSILTQDSITFTVRDTNSRMVFDEEYGDAFYGTEVTLYESFENYSGSRYSIYGGKYYVTAVDKKRKTEYEFSAASILAFMTQKCPATATETGLWIARFVISTANASEQVPSSTITGIFDEDALSAVKFRILESDDYSLAEVLQLVANACGCILFVDRYGRINIVKRGTMTEHYILSGKVCYTTPQVKFSERIGDTTLISNHGGDIASTDYSGYTVGGRQIITNPIINDNNTLDICVSMFNKLSAQRKSVSASCRFDPALDLFDIIVVPHGETVEIGCVTDIDATYNGAWKGTIQTTIIPDAEYDLRIKDLEMLTIEQIEHLRIEQLHPNTISDITGDYIATENGELALWYGGD